MDKKVNKEFFDKSIQLLEDISDMRNELNYLHDSVIALIRLFIDDVLKE